MNNEQLHYLNAMDIPVWQLRENVQSPKQLNVRNTLEKEVENSIASPPHSTRKQLVFGAGNTDAKIMIIGEAPSGQEDAEGEPFAGQTGLLLNDMLIAIGLHRHDTYAVNIVKCSLKSDVINQYAPLLQQQINLIKPDIIMAVGTIAAHHLLNTEDSLEKLRGKLHHFGEKKTPLIVTFHPADLLRTPKDKRKALEDLLLLKSSAEISPEKTSN